jgi:glycosyltransferase involved in cell wall biosynthesis
MSSHMHAERRAEQHSDNKCDTALEGKSCMDRACRPKASICIPAYQAERHIRATINSVLTQNYADLEIVIVDNNSSDGTREILEEIDDERVRVIRNATTLSMVDNWNLAVRESHGEFVKLVCADDILESDCIAAQIAVLEGNPDVALVSARTNFIDDDGKLLRRAVGPDGVIGRHSGERAIRQIVRGGGNNPIGTAAAMFRRVDFDRCGGFDGDLLFLMDVDLWVRLLREGDFFGAPNTFASFRIWLGSITASTSAHSHLAQRRAFATRLVNDPRWNITIIDRIRGRVAGYDLQFDLLYKLSAIRAWWRCSRALPRQGRDGLDDR